MSVFASAKTNTLLSPIILALDYADKNTALAVLENIDPQDCRLKVGKEMFTRFGPQFINELQQRDFEVFLDLKFHDIPHTVAQAVTAAADLGVWMVNLHACGGEKMMIAAREALLPFGQEAPLLIAVTLLTSIEWQDLDAIGLTCTPTAYVERLARLAQGCGLDGVVCSGWEVQQIKELCGADFKRVTPGIRLSTMKDDDQRRIMTPIQAIEVGANYLVIGRSITQAADPAKILAAVVKDLSLDNR